jgi:hypothetical protein
MKTEGSLVVILLKKYAIFAFISVFGYFRTGKIVSCHLLMFCFQNGWQNIKGGVSQRFPYGKGKHKLNVQLTL